MVYADSTMVAVHALRPGTRTIVLARKASVTDVITGRFVGADLEELTFTVTTPVTHWYRLAP